MQSRRNRIEKPAARTRQRHVDSGFQHAIDRPEWFGVQVTMEFECGESFDELSPARPSDQMRIRVAPGFANGLNAAHHRDGLESGNSPVAAIIGEQKLTAPNRAVSAKSQTVNRNSEHGWRIHRDSVFHHATGDVRVMVLNFQKRQLVVCCALFGEFGGKIFRVHIRDQHARPVIVNP